MYYNTQVALLPNHMSGVVLSMKEKAIVVIRQVASIQPDHMCITCRLGLHVSGKLAADTVVVGADVVETPTSELLGTMELSIYKIIYQCVCKPFLYMTSDVVEVCFWCGCRHLLNYNNTNSYRVLHKSSTTQYRCKHSKK